MLTTIFEQNVPMCPIAFLDIHVLTCFKSQIFPIFIYHLTLCFLQMLPEI